MEGCFKRVVRISARQEGFSDALRGAILDLIAVEKPDPDAALLANERQRAAAARAKQALDDALGAAAAGFAGRGVGLCGRRAGRLVRADGERASDAVIDEVFSKFCVGK